MDIVHLDRESGLTCSDVSIREPSARTYVRTAARTDGWAIQVAERAKNTKYRQTVAAAGFRFRPLVAESAGRWSAETAHFLSQLAKPMADAAENNSTFVRNRIIDRGWKQLGCALHKYNAYLLLSRTMAAANAYMIGEGGLQSYFTPYWV